MAENLMAGVQCHGRGAGLWAALRGIGTGCRQSALGIQRVGELDQDLVETHHGVGQSCGDRRIPEDQACFRRLHGIAVQTTHPRDLVDEDPVQPIDLRLQGGGRLWRQRCMGRKVVLVVTGVDRRVGNPVLGILDGLVDVQGNDADGPDSSGLGEGQARCSGCDGVSSRVRRGVGVRPDRLDVVGGANPFGQLEYATGLTAG